MFHLSCLVHWILICEHDMITNNVALPKVKKRTKRKTGINDKKNGKDDTKAAGSKIKSVFCPECQGTGIPIIDGDQLERLPFSLQEVCSLVFFSFLKPFRIFFLFQPHRLFFFPGKPVSIQAKVNLDL